MLIVDDDRASLDLLAIYLDGYPVQVLRAHDGREALAAVGRAGRGRRPRHPAARGRRLAGAGGAPADPATAGLPVIVVSVVDERPRGLALGASDYLDEAGQLGELVGALRRLGALPEPKAATAPTGVGA